MTKDIENLLSKAKDVEMTPTEKEEQRRSFAFGNSNIENKRITRETVNREADALDRGDVNR